MADMKLEVIVIPVAGVDRAKEFYGRLGWRPDADRTGDGFRLVQFTPPGSGCSIQFGRFRNSAQDTRLSAPGDASYGSFAWLTGPDGNSWLFQQVTARVPGRVDPAATELPT